MQCPVDGATLLMTERQGVEIDYCPTCRGVWLDRGELDKLVERSDRDGRADDRGFDDGPMQHPRRKRKGWFGEMFDFD